jgi:glycosyltransferase involved in cell wall biosynthesis
MSDLPFNSQLDSLIPGEIKHDPFYQLIQSLVQQEEVQTVLEIGSSSGEGSTEAFVTGLRNHPKSAHLFCMEISKTRYAALQQRYQQDAFVHCYNVSSVAPDQFATAADVIEFYNTISSNLNRYLLHDVLAWLHQDIEYVLNAGVESDGIQIIKHAHQIENFDVVLIDGSEFTGQAELREIYGATYILLDDINTYKNYHNHQRLLADPSYVLLEQNSTVRHGYSAFKKVERSPSAASDRPPLPIHFFTIVLNGEPFIRYHIDVFKQLTIPWHWHIVEGVADLKHDTSWSVRLGGQIGDTIHNQGLSIDGTTAYLDELQQQYGDRITLYRKPEGAFWDGKQEMVNAPLANLNEECLLWQVDVDELWTVEQISTAHQLFVNHPEKTAAYYWCWYFVGSNLVISTRNCYTQNPNQDWLRTWRYRPGDRWATHEPPRLVAPQPDGGEQDVAMINPFRHEQTEAEHLIFQHFAYVTVEQLQFKEHYYGYRDALTHWQRLQSETRFPVRLRQYFPWVSDYTMVDRAEAMGVIPLAQVAQGQWHFLTTTEEIQGQTVITPEPTPVIVIDGVFFQRYKTGIARVWRSLLQEWAVSGFAQHIILLDRSGTAPDIAGIRYQLVPPYNANDVESDRQMLQQICDQLQADVFISTYFTTPISTPSVVLVYDMIPEVMGEPWHHPIVQEKRRAIALASDYLAISQNTADDLVCLLPEILKTSVKVARCGVSDIFKPASSAAIDQFCYNYGITKPYFVIISADNPSPYKNNDLFFQAFAQLVSKTGFELVCTAFEPTLPAAWRQCSAGTTVHLLKLNDEDLAIAYSGAIALVYPSKYEGFGMPVLEAMACGCPVITCPNASLPEVAGEAALYVSDDDVDALAEALCDIQKPNVRNALIKVGLERSRQFSWANMAQIVADVLIDTTLASLNLKQLNILLFVDWTQSEADLYEALGAAIAVLIHHPDQSSITYLIDISTQPPELDISFFLGDIMMNLLMDSTVLEEPDITLMTTLSTSQWDRLATHMSGYLQLGKSPQGAIAQAQHRQIPSLTLDELVQLNVSSATVVADHAEGQPINFSAI